jgi:hypothetical protein
MSTATLNFAVTFTVLTCCNAECGVQWAMTDEYIARRRKDHAWFYCPSGHQQHYSGETPEEKRIRELEAEKEKFQRWHAGARQDATIEREARKSVERRLSATKGVLTRTKNRVARGVCPCCNRTVSQLARHMAAKHPEYTPAPTGATTEG